MTVTAQAGVQRHGPPLQQPGNRESGPDAGSRNQAFLIKASGTVQNLAREAEETQCAAPARACNRGPQQPQWPASAPLRPADGRTRLRSGRCEPENSQEDEAGGDHKIGAQHDHPDAIEHREPGGRQLMKRRRSPVPPLHRGIVV
jgi:hypothetical protein